MSNSTRNDGGSNDSGYHEMSLMLQSDTEMVEAASSCSPEYKQATNILNADHVNTVDQRTCYNYFSVPPGARLRIVDKNEIKIEDLAAINPPQQWNDILKNEYRNTVLPPVHWLTANESFDWEYHQELPLMDATTESNINQITENKLYNMLCSKIGARLLIEGENGCGKTTLVTKIAHDWASEEKECLKKFDSVIFIRMDKVEIKTNKLEDLVMQRCPGMKQNFLTDENLENILLILDGYDKHYLPGDFQKDIIEVLHRKKYSTMTVLVTCRTGHLPLTSEELEKHFPMEACGNVNFYDKKITFGNVSTNARGRFLKRFCPDGDLPDSSVDVPGCPRMLFIIGVCLRKKMKVNVKSSLTDLYASLLNSIVKHNLNIEDEDFDVFDDNNEESVKYQKRLEDFGMVCLKHLSEKNPSFTKNEIDSIQEFGFMSKQNYPESDYECFHWSFLAFLVAYAMWRKLKKGWVSRCFLSKDIRRFQALPWNCELSLTCQFISGLLQENVKDFLKELSTFKIEKFEIVFWRMVAELNERNQLPNHVAKFVPKVIHRASDPLLARFYCSDFHRDIVEQAIKFHLKRIVFNCDFPLLLPSGLEIPTLDVIVRALNDVEHLANLQEVHCLLLNYLLKIEPSNDDNVVYENCLPTFHSIAARNVKILFLAQRLHVQLQEMLVQDGFETEFCPSLANSICPLRETKFDCTSINICNTCMEKKRSGKSASQQPQLKLVICSHQ